MNILMVADEECKYLWDYYERGRLDNIDLIISAGDLKPEYLSFLVTMSNVPLLYVHGNHDGKYDTKPPEGCICIDDDIYVFNGIRIMGLGGSMLYNGNPYQYTERQMAQRYHKLFFKLILKGGIDILVTHAPAYQLGDSDDIPHKGFRVFRKILEKYHPKYYIHGHMHQYFGWKEKTVRSYEGVTIINAFNRYAINYETGEKIQL